MSLGMRSFFRYQNFCEYFRCDKHQRPYVKQRFVIYSAKIFFKRASYFSRSRLFYIFIISLFDGFCK